MKNPGRKEDNTSKALSAPKSVPRKSYSQAVSERELKKENTHL
jgi:hypothetical protein